MQSSFGRFFSGKKIAAKPKRSLERISAQAVGLAVLLWVFSLPLSAQGGTENIGALGVQKKEKGQLGAWAKGFNNLSSFKLDRAILDFVPLLVHYSRNLERVDNRIKSARILTLMGRTFDFDENEIPGAQCYGLAHILAPNDAVISAYLARDLSYTQRRDEADKLWETLSTKAKDNLEIATLFAQRSGSEVMDSEADSLLRRALAGARIRSSAAESYANRCLGRRAVRIESPQAAANYYRKAAMFSTSAYSKKLLLARAFLCERNPKSAKALYEEAGALLPNDPSWLIGLVHVHGMTAGCVKSDTVLKYCLTAVNCRRCSSCALHALADYLNAHGTVSEAHRCLHYLEDLRPNAAYPHLWNAQIYRCKKELAPAENEIRAAIALNPLCADAWIGLSEVLAQQGKKGESIDALNQGIVFCPADARLRCSLGKALVMGTSLKEGEAAEEAKHAYEVALTLMPAVQDNLNILALRDISDAYAGLGSCEYRAGKHKQALEAAKLFNKYKLVIHLPGALGLIPVRPDHLDFEHGGNKKMLEHLALADMLRETGQFSDSAKEYRLALEQDPDNLNIHSFLFFTLQESDDWTATAVEDLDLSNRLITRVPSQIGDLLKKALGTK